MAKSFQELAREFCAISGPDSVAIERLSGKAWRLLTKSADKIEWQLFGIDPRHIKGPDSNWDSFANRAGDTGNVRDAHPDVVHSQTRRDGYDWRAKSRGYAAVCEWLNEIVASCSLADQQSRLIRLARWHSNDYAWARLWDWLDSLKEDDKRITALENMLTLKLRAGTISVAECEDSRELNMYCYARSITMSDLTTMFRDYYTLEQGLRTWFPALLPLLPIVNTDMPRPTNEKMIEWAERCRQIEAGLLIARGHPEATSKPQKPVEPQAGDAEAGGGKGNADEKHNAVTRVKAVYEWAMSSIQLADEMTITELFNAIQIHPSMTSDYLEKLPNNPETFGQNLRRAGIRRYNVKGDRQHRPSRRPKKR